MKVNLDHLPRSGKITSVLKIAMADLEAAEKAEDVVIDMGNWHFRGYQWVDGEQKPDGPCQVCLAGAVMRGMGVPDDHLGSINPDHMPPEVQNILFALDYFRSGEFRYMEARFNDAGFDCDIPDGLTQEAFAMRVSYEKNPGAFKRWAYDTIAKMEAVGL